MPRYYLLAHASEARHHPNGRAFEWPYEVWVCFERGEPKPIGVREGVGSHTTSGADLPASGALDAQFRRHLSNAAGEWLLPFLENMASGGHPSERDVLSLYRQRHGSEPKFHDRVQA